LAKEGKSFWFCIVWLFVCVLDFLDGMESGNIDPSNGALPTWALLAFQVVIAD
jgi:hypothetical protein